MVIVKKMIQKMRMENMLKIRHATMIMLSGLVWFLIGFFLLQLGLNLLVAGVQSEALGNSASYPLLSSLGSLMGTFDRAAIVIIAISLFFGYFKGKYVLGKAAKRGADHIASLPNPASITKMYGLRYYVLIAIMIALGLSIKYFQVPNDIRGAVDVLIGAALLNGALIYFRMASSAKKKMLKV